MCYFREYRLQRYNLPARIQKNLSPAGCSFATVKFQPTPAIKLSIHSLAYWHILLQYMQYSVQSCGGDGQARNELGTPGWAKSFLVGAQIF